MQWACHSTGPPARHPDSATSPSVRGDPEEGWACHRWPASVMGLEMAAGRGSGGGDGLLRGRGSATARGPLHWITSYLFIDIFHLSCHTLAVHPKEGMDQEEVAQATIKCEHLGQSGDQRYLYFNGSGAPADETVRAGDGRRHAPGGERGMETLPRGGAQVSRSRSICYLF
jgi:hypothetical protein